MPLFISLKNFPDGNMIFFFNKPFSVIVRMDIQRFEKCIDNQRPFIQEIVGIFQNVQNGFDGGSGMGKGFFDK